MLSHQLLEFTKNWVGIQNLIFWYINNEYLIELQKKDVCEDVPVHDCLEQSPENNCTSYKFKKCVNSDRIRQFNIGSIISADSKQYKFIGIVYDKYEPDNPSNDVNEPMDEISHSLFNSSWVKRNVEEFHCYILQNQIDEENIDIYMLISIGGVRYNIYTDIRCGRFINKIKTYIAKKYYNMETEENKKIKNIILCGHSQGSVIAQYVGLGIIQEEPDFFEKKVWIIGSGPFHWIHSDDRRDFEYYKDRICIFVLKCILDNKYTCDGFSIKNYTNSRNSSDEVFLPTNVMHFLEVNIKSKKNLLLQNITNVIMSQKEPIGATVKITNFIEYTNESILQDSNFIKLDAASTTNLHAWNAYRYFFNFLPSSGLFSNIQLLASYFYKKKNTGGDKTIRRHPNKYRMRKYNTQKYKRHKYKIHKNTINMKPSTKIKN